jgi:hypothetical protein
VLDNKINKADDERQIANEPYGNIDNGRDKDKG